MVKSKSLVQGDEAEKGGERERGRLTSSDESAKREHFGTLIDRVYSLVPISKTATVRETPSWQPRSY
jgi:hypothetical protein